ncbi:MAG: hypothetical protein K8R69_08160 [Deltaproteobacteria bacterium]|nr:hypothetical protein [Deltaproteobacteria bacterium]
MIRADLRPLERLPWPSAARAELQAIASEPDPELLTRQLLVFGMEQEGLGRPDLAAHVYAALPSERGRQRIQALQGGGKFGQRAEFLLRHLTQDATDPATILAMAAAGSIFSLTRLATLGGLLQKPASWMTRGFGARALASLVGFAVEAPTFTLIGKLGAASLGRPQDWSGAAWGRDLAPSYLVLGGLKLAGWAQAGGFQRFVPSLPRERFLPTLLQKGGILSGILLGRALEQWTGLRPPQGAAPNLADGLAILLQAHVAGRLGTNFQGGRLPAWNAVLDASSGTAPKQGFSPDCALAGPTGIASERPSPRIERPAILLMASQGDGGGLPPRRPASSWVEKLLQAWEEIPFQVWKPREVPKSGEDEGDAAPYRRQARPYASLAEARNKVRDLREGILDPGVAPERRLSQLRQLPEYLSELTRDPEHAKSLRTLERMLQDPRLPYPEVENWPDILLEREISLPQPVRDFYNQDFQLRLTAAEIYVHLHRQPPAEPRELKQAVTMMEGAVLEPGLSTKFRTYFRRDVWSRSYFEAERNLRKAYLGRYLPLLDALPLGCDQARSGFRMLVAKPIVKMLEGEGPIADYLHDPEFLLEVMRTHASLLRLLPQSLPEV